MLMKKYILSLIIFALALLGCETEFKLKGMSDEPKIYVYGLVGMSDTTVLRVCKTVPLNGITDPDVSREVSEISLTVDGKKVELAKADENTPGVPKGYWWTTDDIPGGSEVILTASADQAKDISSSFNMPDAFPAFEVIYTSAPAFKITFTDDGRTDDCYAIMVYGECTRIKDGETKVTVRACEPYEPDEDFGMETRKDYLDVDMNDGTARLWSDTEFNGKEVSLSLEVWSYIDGINNSKYDEVRERYKAVVYRLTPEFFRYAEVQNHLDHNTLASIGLAPASFTYTNVTNGLGLFAGAAVAETEWFE